MLVPEKSVVMFCGDGTNDAVALSQANIGMHMSEGTDIARSAANAVLVRPSLSRILSLMDLSKAFYRLVVLNFIWAFAYNVSAILPSGWGVSSRSDSAAVRGIGGNRQRTASHRNCQAVEMDASQLVNRRKARVAFLGHGARQS